MNASSNAHNPKDFLNAFFTPELGQGHSHLRGREQAAHFTTSSNADTPDSFSTMQQPSMSNAGSGVGMGMLMGMDERGVQPSLLAGAGIPAPQILLEQQMRLNHLQQLYQMHSQIIQQQIEILNNQPLMGLPSMMAGRPGEQQSFLPTPASSTQLPPQPSPNFVSPMVLQPTESTMHNDNMQQLSQQMAQGQHSFVTQNMISSAPHSAPPNLAFQTYPMHSTPELDFDDMSPLASPWLGPYQNAANSSGSGASQVMPSTIGKRRTVSPTTDEHNAADRPNKRHTPSSRILRQPALGKRSSLRGGTKSLSSTPIFPAAGGSRGLSITDAPGDTPSPVDLSMPPPAPPQPIAPMNFLQNNVSGENTPTVISTSITSEEMQPVTPARLMNLGRLGANNPISSSSQSAQVSVKAAEKVKPKPATRTRSATMSTAQSVSKNSAVPLVSPALKPIRPAGGAVPAIPSAAQQPQPVLAVRKTSHKAAEQKRRDSLKTSFDDLRILLPPIPLPSEDGFPDEPILPGAMPPRGPPKGHVDGPNRGVSKLQLLRCGNDYIRRLKGRVERRDNEIESLRKEISRLRLQVPDGIALTTEEGVEPIDLEKDLDAVEIGLGPVGHCGILQDVDEEDEGGE